MRKESILKEDIIGKKISDCIMDYDLINFIRDFRIVDNGNGSYINISRNQFVNEKIKEVTGLTNLDALYLSKAEVDNLFENCMLLDGSEY